MKKERNVIPENVHWHIVKLDDSAYEIITKNRDAMSKNRGHHASYSDAVRHLDFRSKVDNSDTVWYWKCGKCGKVISSSMHREVPEEPLECYEEQGGCGRVSSFKNITVDVLRERLKGMDIVVDLRVKKI